MFWNYTAGDPPRIFNGPGVDLFGQENEKFKGNRHCSVLKPYSSSKELRFPSKVSDLHGYKLVGFLPVTRNNRVFDFRGINARCRRRNVTRTS